MRNYKFVYLPIFFLLFTLMGFAAENEKKPGPCVYKELDNGRLLLKNDYILLEIDPASGGRGSRLFYKTEGKELAFFGPDNGVKWGGLLGDRIRDETISSEMLSTAYDVSVKKKTFQEVCLLLSYKGGDNIKCEKEIILRNNSTSLDVRRVMSYMAADPNAPKKNIGYWSHQSLRVGKTKNQQAEKNTFFVPTTKGIVGIPFIPGTTMKAIGTEDCYMKDSARGWVAAVNDASVKPVGISYETDFSLLESFYFYMGKSSPNCPTVEDVYFKREMKDGDLFETKAKFTPFRGIKQVTGVGGGIVGEIKFLGKKPQKNNRVSLKIKLYSDADRKVKLSVLSRRLPEKTEHISASYNLSLKIDSISSINSSFIASEPGTYVVKTILTDESGNTLFEMEKPFVLSPSSEKYVLSSAPRKIPALNTYVRKPLTGPETPHVKWLNPLTGKKPHLLFFIPVRSARFLLELAWRGDFTYDYVYYHTGPLLKKSNILLRGAGIERDEEDLLNEYLDRPELDCVVIPNSFKLDKLPENLLKKLAARIARGTGLVMFPYKEKNLSLLLSQDPSLKVKPLSKSEQFLMSERQWSLTGAFPVKASVEGLSSIMSYQGKPFVISGLWGNGRIVCLSAESHNPFQLYTRNWGDDDNFYLREFQEYPDYEYSYLLTLKMINFASKMKSDIRISSLKISGAGNIPGNDGTVALKVENSSGKSRSISVNWELKDPFYQTAGTGKVPVLQIPGKEEKLISLKMPKDLFSGNYRLHIFLKAADKTILDSSVISFKAESSVKITGMKLKNRRCKPGEQVNGEMVVASKAGAPSSAKLIQELITPDKRIMLLSKRQVMLKEGENTINFTFSTPETSSLVMDLRTSLVDKNQILTRRIDYLLIPSTRDKTKLRFESYPLRFKEMGRNLAYFLNKEGFEFGIQYLAIINGSAYYQYTDFNPCFIAMKHNINWPLAWGGSVLSSPNVSAPPRPSGGAELRQGPPSSWPKIKKNDPHNCWRSASSKICFENPKFIQQEKKLMNAYVRKVLPLYRPEYLWRADEAYVQQKSYDKSSWVKAGATDDLCFCEYHLKKFREYIRSEYRSLEELNETWKTQFKSWDDVMPMAGRQVVGRNSIAPYLDYRMFMCRSFSGMILRAKPLLTEAGLPGTRTNANIHWEGPYTCLLAYQIFGKGTTGKISPYYYPRAFDQVRSYVQEPKEKRIIIGYDLWGHSYNDEMYHAWKNVFYGSSGISFYGGTDALAMTCVLTPTFEPGSLYKWMKDLKTGLKESGVAKTVLTAQPDPYQVGIVESYRSMMGYFTEPERFTKDGFYKRSTMGMWHHWKNFYGCYGRVLEDLGVSWRLVNEEELGQGEVPENIKVLIFPRVTCVSGKLWDAIQRFIVKGGVVVADWRFGERNGHGKKTSHENELSSVFGVKRKEIKIESDNVKVSFLKNKLPVKGELTGKNREIGIAVTNGVAIAGYPDKVPAAIVKEHTGDGQAVYLNFTLLNYTGGSQNVRDLLSFICRKANVVPANKIVNHKGDFISGVFRQTYQRGPYTYLALLSKNAKKNISVSLPKSACVYEIGGKGFLGRTDKVKVDLKSANGKLLALIPGEITGLSLTVPSSVRQGEILNWHAELMMKTGQPGDHVLSITMTDPDGHIVKADSVNELTEHGRLSKKWLVAYNDKPGDWTITVRDTISGIFEKKVFRVENIKKEEQ